MDRWPFRFKDSPDDFRVAEVSDFSIGAGPFAVYTLRKRNIGTHEALDELRPQLGRGAIAFGGLKDKYAVTEQFITVEAGPRKNLRTESAELSYLGQSNLPFDSKDIKANRFEIILRDIGPDAAEQLEAILPAAIDWWTPNYFDEQRFGSVGESGVFMAEHWCRGDYEAALRVALTDPNPHDESNDRNEKRLLAEHWNQWHELPILRDPIRHAVVSHLAYRPGDFRGAITRIPHGLRSLYLSAFQSAVWNRLLAESIGGRLDGDQLLGFTVAKNHFLLMPTGREPAAFLADMTLPLPSARQPLPDEQTAQLMADLLTNYNLEYRQLRVKYPRDTFFSKGARPAGFQAVDLHGSADADDRYPSRRKLSLAFDLPRGCYATMFLLRLATALSNAD